MFQDVNVTWGADKTGGTAADTAFGNADAAGGTLYVPKGVYKIGASLTLTSDIRFEQGATLKPVAGVTVTLQGSLDAGVFQVFDLSNSTSMSPCKVVLERVPRVMPQWWGAVGGTAGHDDTNAIQAAINSLTYTGGEVFFPQGRYKITSTLNVPPEYGKAYAGITLRGTGWSFGQTPLSNEGSVIEYTASTGSALSLGPASGDDYPLYDFSMYDLAIQGTYNVVVGEVRTTYGGNLVEMKAVGKCKFENCGFGGLPDVSPVTAGALVYGNFWVDTHFERCQFTTALTGVQKHAVTGVMDSVDNVTFKECVFFRCNTAIDMTESVSMVWLTSCSFEPAASGNASTVKLSGYPAGGVTGCWFGDSNGNGTWLQLGGFGGVVQGNYFSGMGHPDPMDPHWPDAAQVAVELLETTWAPVIEGNYFDNNTTAVKARSNGLVVRGNIFALPPDGVAVDVIADTAASIAYNQVTDVEPSGGSANVYRLGTGTKGMLVDQSGATVDNDAPSNWITRLGTATTYPFGATLNAAYIVNQGSLELQGQLLMTGSAGSPAFSNRFISDAGSTNTFFYNVPSGGSHLFGENGAALLQLEKTGAATNETAAILLRNHSGTWTAQRVSEGATDSGGSGYRVLRIPN